jgi:hypothetical protein
MSGTVGIEYIFNLCPLFTPAQAAAESRWSWRVHHNAKAWVRCKKCSHWVWEHGCHVLYDEANCDHGRMDHIMHGTQDCRCETTVTALGGVSGGKMPDRGEPRHDTTDTCPDCGAVEQWQKFMDHDRRCPVTKAHKKRAKYR